MINLGKRGSILTDAAGSDGNVVHPAAMAMGLMLAIVRPLSFYAVLMSLFGYYCGPAPNSKPLVDRTGWMKLV